MGDGHHRAGFAVGNASGLSPSVCKMFWDLSGCREADVGTRAAVRVAHRRYS